MVQLLLPFAAGQVSRLWIAGWVERSRKLLGLVDRGSILLVVYSALQRSGHPRHLAPGDSCSRPAQAAGRLPGAAGDRPGRHRLERAGLRFSKEDEIAIVFCGSKKSLASGVPMAGILFPPASVGLMILPLMLFHQLQLMACAVIAQRYADRAPEPALAPAPAE